MLVLVVNVDQPGFDRVGITQCVLLVNDVVRGLCILVRGTAHSTAEALLTMRYNNGSELCVEFFGRESWFAMASSFRPGISQPTKLKSFDG